MIKTNVSGRIPRLWVHCFSAHLWTAIVVKELLTKYNTSHNIRHRYLLSKKLISGLCWWAKIPRHLQSANKITTYFKNVYPEAVQSFSIAQNLLEKVAAMALAEENHYIMWWDNTLWLWRRECTICKKNSDTGSKTETTTTRSSLIFYVKAILIWMMNTKVVIKYTNAHENESYYVRNLCDQFLLLFNKHQRTLCPNTSR